MKINENLWKPMKTNENRWKTMKINENQWKPMETNGKPMKTDGKAMTTDENQWKSMKINENQWKSMKINENQWKPMKTDETNGKPMKTKENKWKSMKTNVKKTRLLLLFITTVKKMRTRACVPWTPRKGPWPPADPRLHAVGRRQRAVANVPGPGPDLPNLPPARRVHFEATWPATCDHKCKENRSVFCQFRAQLSRTPKVLAEFCAQM